MDISQWRANLTDYGRNLLSTAVHKKIYIMESWLSGRKRRSWKPLKCELPGVRIPNSPPVENCTHPRENEKCVQFFFLHVMFWCKYSFWKTKDWKPISIELDKFTKSWTWKMDEEKCGLMLPYLFINSLLKD